MNYVLNEMVNANDNDHILYTRWLRVQWNDVIAIGVGFDLLCFTLGLYLGPVSVFVGSDGTQHDED